ncbi:hypothetical protein BDA99DRAFT_523730 [Phascolomyces articulosus]|uniref:Uncharacterized protein n=1 Tax=Phascolomyces articulosus TaxID=60185 RepID=A0AAD5K195_9FUNG|nr:hypothetical protein BDA99DRAFT_523730 [Phascolomyces articulosus]
MGQQSIRKKRKLPKREAFDFQETSPGMDIPIPGSETFISPSEVLSPFTMGSGRTNKYSNPITVGTPTLHGKSRSRHHVNRPLTRPSENFAERLQRVLSNNDDYETSEDDFMILHSILPTLDHNDNNLDNSSKGNSSLDNVVPDENTLPQQQQQTQFHSYQQRHHYKQSQQQQPHQSNPNNNDTTNNERKYKVIPRKVKSKDNHHNNNDDDKDVEDKNMKNDNVDTKICMPDEKKLVDSKAQVVIKHEDIPLLAGKLPCLTDLLSPSSTLSDNDDLFRLTEIEDDDEDDKNNDEYDEDDDDYVDEDYEEDEEEEKEEGRERLSPLMQRPQQPCIQFQLSERIQKKLNKRKRSPKQLSDTLERLRMEARLEWICSTLLEKTSKKQQQ